MKTTKMFRHLIIQAYNCIKGHASSIIIDDIRPALFNFFPKKLISDCFSLLEEYVEYEERVIPH